MYNVLQKTKRFIASLLFLALILGSFPVVYILADDDDAPLLADDQPVHPVAADTDILCALQNWVVPGSTTLPFPQSGITLPDRRLTDSERAAWIDEYWEMAGPVAFELEVIRLINEIRGDNGRNLVSPDPTLAMAARFYAQTKATVGDSGHNVGPYREPDGMWVGGVWGNWGASRNVAEAFGASLSGWSAGNSAAGQQTPEQLVQGWMNSPGHCRYILNPDHNYIGTGTHTRIAAGSFSVFHYLFFSRTPSQLRYTATVVGGTISSDLYETDSGSFLAGETVEISATAPDGQRFVRWEGPDSVTFADATSENTTFEMPSGDVTVTAIFEPIPTTAPVTTVPETTAPETTAPETTDPGTTDPTEPTTDPETTDPETTDPGTLDPTEPTKCPSPPPTCPSSPPPTCPSTSSPPTGPSTSTPPTGPSTSTPSGQPGTPGPTQPSLPQTGAVVGTSMMFGGLALVASGLAIVPKKKRD